MLPILREPCDESVIRSLPAAAPCSKRAGRWVLAATTLASSMAFIDGTVVNVALPALQANLNATIVDVQWVIEAYSLLLAALLLVGGSLGDHYGRRRVFLIGVALFAAASTWCGLAPDIHQLIIARAAQGLGAALLVPGSLAIISSSFPENERGRAIGTWSGFSAITTAVGPVIGGWLIEHISWRAVFFINVPIALLVIFISLGSVPESSDKESAGLDWRGAIAGTLGLGGLVYGLIESSRLGFGDRSLIAALVVAIALLALFFVPSVGGSYWTNFFPATVVLGLGMAISVAPLTTTVMNSVVQNRVGIASGVNNAVARSAGLIAVAALGIVMLKVFNHALDRRLAEWNMPASVSRSLQVERTKLADIALPDDQDPATRQLIRRAVEESFVSGFRVVMIIGTALALAGAGTALTLIGRSNT